MIKAQLSKVKNLIRGRHFAYNYTFNKDNAYAQAVLKDLAKFCRAHETTFNKDQRLHAVAEGRREVWLRIEKQLNLSVEELYRLYDLDKLNEG